VLDEIGNK